MFIIATFDPKLSIKPFEWKGWELEEVSLDLVPLLEPGEVSLMLELKDSGRTRTWRCARTHVPIVVAGRTS